MAKNLNGKHDGSAQSIYAQHDPIALNQLKRLAANATSRSVQDLRNLAGFDPRRSIDDECGYPDIAAAISLDTYKQLYDRLDIAARVVEVMAKESWQVTPSIEEDDDPETETEFEQAWIDLGQTVNKGGQSWLEDAEGSPVWTELRKADILSGIGHFGIILLGIDDGKNLADPLDGVVTVNSAGFPLADSPMSPAERKLLEQPPARKMLALNEVKPNRDPKTGEVNDPTWNAWKVVDWQPPPLTDDEKQTINVWAWEHDERVKAQAAFSRPVVNEAGQTVRPPQFVPLSRIVAKTVVLNRNPQELLGQDQVQQMSWGQPAPQSFGGAAPQRGGAFGNPAEGGTGGRGDPRLGSDTGQADDREKLSATDYGQPSLGTDQQYFGVQFGPSEKIAEGAGKTKRKLKFMRSFDESLVQIVRYEWDVTNPRFGMPVMYRVTLNDPREVHSGIGLPLATVFVHWSRIIHLADHHDNAASSMVFAPPRMRPCLNALLDIRKIRGAGAEGSWKMAFTKLSFETHPTMGGDVIVDEEGLRDQYENESNSQQGLYVLRGMTAKPIAPTVTDPTPHNQMALEAICIKIGIPMRVFQGSERGNLASNQDDASWNDRLRERQHKYITPMIIAPFIDRLIQIGVLPEPESYHVRWPDLDSLTEKDKAQICLWNTQAANFYVTGGLDSFIAPASFLSSEKFFNLDKEETEKMLGETADHLAEANPEADEGEIVPGHAGGVASTPQADMEDQMKQQAAAIKSGVLPDPNKVPPMMPQKLGAGQTLHNPDTGDQIAKSPFKPAPSKPPSAKSPGAK